MRKDIRRSLGYLTILALAGCVAATPGTHVPGTQPVTTTKTAVASGIANSVLTGTVVAPAGVIAAGAGNVIAAGAGNVIAAGAGNVIAGGAGNFASRHVLGLSEKPLANTEVYLADAAGAPIPSIPAVKTDADGKYQFPNVPAGYTFVVAAKIKTSAGKDATLQTLAKTSTLGATADVSTASTFVAVDIADSEGDALTDFNPASFQTAVQATAGSLQDSDLPDLSDRAAVKAKLIALSQKVSELQSALSEIQKELADVKASLSQVKQELADSLVSNGNGGPPDCHALLMANDLDNDGALTLADFQRILADAASHGAQHLPTPDDAFRDADTSRDGKVTEDELCAFFSAQATNSGGQQGQGSGQMGPGQMGPGQMGSGNGGNVSCPQNFTHYDTNGDGVMSADEFDKMYQEQPQLGAHPDGTRASADELFKSYDANGDGKINSDDFCRPGPQSNGTPGPTGGGTPFPQPNGTMQPMGCSSPMPHAFRLQSGDAGSPTKLRLQATSSDGNQVYDEQDVATSTLRVTLSVPEGCPFTLNLLQAQKDGTFSKMAWTQQSVQPGSTDDVNLGI
ncbi:MAG TPA: EF-hand domain-containing protein [Oscillatoriaceae cyanobacterium]